MSKKLSVVIVTYNSERLIFDCLDSILKYNDIGNQLEIILVDNNSDDCDRVFHRIETEYRFEILLIRNPINIGYGAANNIGILKSESPISIVMNPDVRLIEPVFEKIIEKFENNEKLGLLGVKFSDGSNHLYFKPEKSTFLNVLFFKQYIKFGWYKIEDMFFSGSFLVFDKKAFITAGLFDENIFLYNEEADVSNRILLLNKETVLAEDIFVLHLVHGRDINVKLLEYGAISRKYYFEKYNGNLNKHYLYNQIVFGLKFIVASIINDKLKKAEFKAWYIVCRNRGQF